jgi:hypothetical protein
MHQKPRCGGNRAQTAHHERGEVPKRQLSHKMPHGLSGYVIGLLDNWRRPRSMGKVLVNYK